MCRPQSLVGSKGNREARARGRRWIFPAATHDPKRTTNALSTQKTNLVLNNLLLRLSHSALPTTSPFSSKPLRSRPEVWHTCGSHSCCRYLRRNLLHMSASEVLLQVFLCSKRLSTPIAHLLSLGASVRRRCRLHHPFLVMSRILKMGE